MDYQKALRRAIGRQLWAEAVSRDITLKPAFVGNCAVYVEYPSPSGKEVAILPLAAVKKWLEDMVGLPRVNELGPKNAALVESARTAVRRVLVSEAAQAGWLGDVDFTADLQAIEAPLRKEYSLKKLIGDLSALDNPSSDDRRILAEAIAAAAELERSATNRVNLIQQCAAEAEFIDKSLRAEREDARTAQKRAALHAELGAMLYGIEAAPDAMPAESAAADTVMSRVQAYREIKNQIQAI